MKIEKLKQLADDLIDNNIEFDEFHFDRYTGKLKCGTVGCALGHYATRSPDWDIVDGVPVWNEREVRPYFSPILDAKEYFEIPHVVALFLFSPISAMVFDSFSEESIKDCEKLGMKRLSADATQLQVAENINLIIELYEEDNSIFDSIG